MEITRKKAAPGSHEDSLSFVYVPPILPQHPHGGPKQAWDVGQEEVDTHLVDGVPKVDVLEKEGAQTAKEETHGHGAEKDDEEIHDREAHAGSGEGLRAHKLGEDVEEHQSHRVVQDALPEHQVKHERVHLELLEDRQDRDRVRGGDERPEGEAFGHGQGVREVGLGECVEGQADKKGGEESAYHSVENDGNEVVQENLAAQGVSAVENNGRQEADKKHRGAADGVESGREGASRGEGIRQLSARSGPGLVLSARIP